MTLCGQILPFPRRDKLAEIGEYVSNRPSIPAKEIVGDSDTFIEFTRRILSVPHEEIKEKLDAEREAKRTSKASASRVSAVSSKAR